MLCEVRGVRMLSADEVTPQAISQTMADLLSHPTECSLMVEQARKVLSFHAHAVEKTIETIKMI
jgi:UDP-N-acetylglucosamine:LPS N-acetylglucosamine transferase